MDAAGCFLGSSWAQCCSIEGGRKVAVTQGFPAARGNPIIGGNCKQEAISARAPAARECGAARMTEGGG